MLVITLVVSWLGDMDVPGWWWVLALLIDLDGQPYTREVKK